MSEPLPPPSKKPKPNRPEPSLTRKAAQASRAQKACELCRKQKTRCFKATETSNSCLRCSFMNKECSFAHEIMAPSAAGLAPPSSADDKLSLIYSGVSEILSLLKNGKTTIDNNDARLLLDAANSMKKGTSTPSTPVYESYEAPRPFSNPIDLENQADFQSPTRSLHTAPFKLMQNQFANPSYTPKPISNLLNLTTVNSDASDTSDDIITMNIISESEAINLMNDFRRNYGRWISFPSNLPTEILIDRLRRKSTLLLTTCCALSLRYSLSGVNPGDINNLARRKNTFKLMIKQLILEFNCNLIKINSFRTLNGDIEFLQSLVILSIYSFSLTSIIAGNGKSKTALDETELFNGLKLSFNDLNFDPWYLSGLGLTTFVSKTTIGTLMPKTESKLNNIINNITSPFTILYDEELDSNEYQTLTIMRIYNHLILVHLINCLFSGRMCLVDEIRLNYCNITLGLPSSTNFDGRMVSEISILLITYNYIQVNLNVKSLTEKDIEANFKAVREEVKSWYEQWEYLLNQPALQFVELCYNFCNILIYYTYTFASYIPASDVGIAGSLYEEDTVSYVLQNCTRDSLLKIYENANNLLGFIKLITNDSYFAYLSDQVHFCFYFGAIIYIKLLKYLSDQQGLGLINVVELDAGSFDTIKQLMGKFERICQNNDDDVVTKYKIGIQRSLKQNFPQFI